MPTCANLRRVAQARQRGVAWRRFLKGFDAVLGSRGVSHRSSSELRMVRKNLGG